jgi:hypothetical protein
VDGGCVILCGSWMGLDGYKVCLVMASMGVWVGCVYSNWQALILVGLGVPAHMGLGTALLSIIPFAFC